MVVGRCLHCFAFDFPEVCVVVWESKDNRVREGEERVRLWGG